MNPSALSPLPMHYFAPRPDRATGQKLASTTAGHSVLVAPAIDATPQLTETQPLTLARPAACGLPYEGYDHV